MEMGYLLELWRVNGVSELRDTLWDDVSFGQEGHQALLNLRIGQQRQQQFGRYCFHYVVLMVQENKHSDVV